MTQIVALWMCVAASAAVADDHHRFIHLRAGGFAAAVPAMPKTIETGEAVWIWGPDCLPMRVLDGRLPECSSGTTVAVRVTMPGGRPAEKVEIRWGSEVMIRELPDALLPVANTDPSGQVVIEIPEGERLYVRAAGPALASPWVPLLPPVTTVKAVEGIALKIKVMDPNGRPAAGARVELQTEITQRNDLAFDGNDEGTVYIPAVPAAAFVQATIWSEAGAPRLFSGAPASLLRPVELDPGVSIQASVVDENRKPVGRALASTEFPVGESGQTITKAVWTDSSGRLAVTGLPKGHTELRIVERRFASLARIVPLPHDRDLGEIMLKPDRELTILVSDANGKPIGRASLTTPDGVESRTDDRGIALLASVPAAPFHLRIRADGYLRQELTVPTESKQPFAVTLRNAAVLYARLVRAADGSPAGPGTAAVDAGGRMFIDEFGMDGELSIDLGEGGPASVEIRVEGLSPYRLPERTTASGERVDLGTIELGKGLSLSGRTIAAETSEPLPGVAIYVLRPSDFGPLLSFARKDWLKADSQADGTFRVEGLAPGVYTLWSEASGRAPVIRSGLTISSELPAGELELGDLPISAGKMLVVSCTPATRCGTRASVIVDGADWLPLHAGLEEGHGSVAPVPTGPALLRLSDRSGSIHERAIEIAANEPATEIVIRLPSVTVRGEVTRGGRKVAGGTLSFHPVTSGSGRLVQLAHGRASGTIGNTFIGSVPAHRTTPLSDEGTFVLDGLAPGDYRVRWTSNGVPAPERRVSIPETGVMPLRIDMPASRLEGTVRSADGTQPPRAVIRAEARGTRTETLASADGSFAFDGLPEGPCHVSAVAADRKTGQATVQIVVNETSHVEITLDGTDGSPLTVMVRSAGMPVANSYVFVRQREQLRSAMTSASGTVRFAAAPADELFELAVFAPGRGWAFLPARSLPPGNEVVVDVQASTGGIVVQKGKGSGAVAVFTPSGFPLHAAMALLGAPVAVTSGTPLRLDRLPAGDYRVTVAGVEQQVAVMREPRLVGF